MKEKIELALQKVPMPGSKQSIVEHGVVASISYTDDTISIELRLPQEQEKFAQALPATIEAILKHELKFEGKIQVLVAVIKANRSGAPGGVSKVKHIIAVASGKGGVGKSTVCSNLAITFAAMGYKVGLLDADIFGPSVPKMFQLEDGQPTMKKIGDKEFMEPIEQYGIKLLSVGFFVKTSDALAWRGPIASNVLKQFLLDADWGELDFLFLDMPPGTSDIQLTIAQTLDLTGAVMVSTPQQVAVIDVHKGIDFFLKDGIGVPVLGLVENMAWFTPAELPDNKYYIFGKGGAQELAEQLSIPFLGSVPIVQSICEGGEEGTPISLQENHIITLQFKTIAENLLKQFTF